MFGVGLGTALTVQRLNFVPVCRRNTRGLRSIQAAIFFPQRNAHGTGNENTPQLAKLVPWANCEHSTHNIHFIGGQSQVIKALAAIPREKIEAENLSKSAV